jgi:serine/threonine protein kinase/WD40 repeat protein
MQERDLILGVLATQAGFATPTQVMEAAAARLIGKDGPSLLTYLERNGALTPARRVLLEAMASEAMAARNGDTGEVLRSLGGDAAVSRTFGPQEAPDSAVRRPVENGVRTCPLEREGQYTRLDELGRGAQSVVRRAIDEFVGREVALKELLTPADHIPASRSPSAARARFLREARLTAQLDHPGIAPVHEVAHRPDGTLFSSQKLIRGRTLKARLARCESLSERLELLPHLIDVCQALAYAHSRAVIHRDVKPSNIMVGEYGETVLLDWGLAKKRGEDESRDAGSASPEDPFVTVAGQALGTPSYMSPEQARGAVAEIDERSDVFGLGAILYEILTGRVPFEGATAERAMENVLAGRLAPVRSICPEAPPELIAVVDRALQKEPASRYQTAGALARELLAFRSGRRVEAYEYRSWELVKKFIRRNRALSVVSGVGLLVLLVSAVAIAYQLRVARLNLAASLLERAQLAEQAADWGRAAGYYAASRLERDSREAQWGTALAREQIPRRVLARTGADRSFVGVVHDKDGQPLVLAVEPPWVIARDLASGGERWRYESKDRLTDAGTADGRYVEVFSALHLTYLDGSSGQVVDTFERAGQLPCPWGPPTHRALVAKGMFTVSVPGAPDVSWKAGGRPVCAVSSDIGRIAFRDLDGVVHLWSLDEGQELASRPAPDTSQLLFTAHGLAAVRGRSVQVFGGPDGDFSIGLPARGNGPLLAASSSANAVSPDGHRLVVSSLTASQANVIDLRTRSIVSSVSFAAGAPRLAFSPSGDRLLVSGLLNGTTLEAWELPSLTPPRVFPGTPLQEFHSSRDGRRLLVFLVDPARFRFELRDENGTVLLEGPVVVPGGVAISADGRKIAISDERGAVVRDGTTGRPLGRVDCEDCYRLALSADGGRLLMASEKRIALWDVVSGQIVWSETERLGRLTGPLHLSGDGRSVLWGRERTLYLHREGKNPDGELKLEQRVESARFSYDGTRLAAQTAGTIGVWGAVKLDPRWRVRNPSWIAEQVLWSGDDSAVMIMDKAQGVTLWDSTTGQRFATIGLSTPGSYGMQVEVLPDLRHRLSTGHSAWEISVLPPPDDGPPRESLARVLAEAGLEMSGVELIDAPPAPSPGGNLPRH